jgi:hypothetical protein
MKPLSTGLSTLAFAFLSLFLRPVQAQTTAGASRAAVPIRYELAEEVSLTGTVSSVLAKAAPGMIAGSHLLLQTPSGPVDASLGRFGLQGAGAIPIECGQQIEATGVMRTNKGRSLFLVRTLKVGGQVYTIRNQHGFPISPQARERAGRNIGQIGEPL